MPRYHATKGKGYLALITCNHDTPRARLTLTPEELKIAYACLFTLPGIPFLYYGDEIGMRYLDLPTKEGGYTRTGTRTPMQWTSGKNLGFSEADADRLYLPVDPAADAPTVEAQAKDADSLYQTIRALLKLRGKSEDLGPDASFAVLSCEAGEPFVYRRGNAVCVVNPSGTKKEITVPGTRGLEKVFRIGEASRSGETICIGSSAFAIFY